MILTGYLFRRALGKSASRLRTHGFHDPRQNPQLRRGAHRTDLDGTVKQVRETDLESDATYPLGAEDLAVGVEQLAARLAEIRNALAPHLGSDGAAGDLARTIDAIVLPEAEPAIAMVEAAYAGDRNYALAITERCLYGQPDLRHGYRHGFDHETSRGNHVDYLVHLPSRSVSQVPENTTVFAAAHAHKTRLETSPEHDPETTPEGRPEQGCLDWPAKVLAGRRSA